MSAPRHPTIVIWPMLSYGIVISSTVPSFPCRKFYFFRLQNIPFCGYARILFHEISDIPKQPPNWKVPSHVDMDFKTSSENQVGILYKRIRAVNWNGQADIS